MSYGLSKPPSKLIQLSFPEGKSGLLARLFFGNPVNPLTATAITFLFFPRVCVCTCVHACTLFFSCCCFLSFFFFFSPPAIPSLFSRLKIIVARSNVSNSRAWECARPINFRAKRFKALNRVQRVPPSPAGIAFFPCLLFGKRFFSILSATSGQDIKKISCARWWCNFYGGTFQRRKDSRMRKSAE